MTSLSTMRNVSRAFMITNYSVSFTRENLDDAEKAIELFQEQIPRGSTYFVGMTNLIII